MLFNSCLVLRCKGTDFWAHEQKRCVYNSSYKWLNIGFYRLCKHICIHRIVGRKTCCWGLARKIWRALVDVLEILRSALDDNMFGGWFLFVIQTTVGRKNLKSASVCTRDPSLHSASLWMTSEGKFPSPSTKNYWIPEYPNTHGAIKVRHERKGDSYKKKRPASSSTGC